MSVPYVQSYSRSYLYIVGPILGLFVVDIFGSCRTIYIGDDKRYHVLTSEQVDQLYRFRYAILACGFAISIVSGLTICGCFCVGTCAFFDARRRSLQVLRLEIKVFHRF